MLYFAIALAAIALIAVIASRVWMLRRIQQAQRDGERPFDQKTSSSTPMSTAGGNLTNRDFPLSSARRSA